MLPSEPLTNHAETLLAQCDAALKTGEIDEARWFTEISSVITPSYLSGDNPRAQSGHSGDEAHWKQARELILDAVHHDGTFLDIGCANGYLMESLARWALDKGCTLEPHGLDISPDLVQLAKIRLPHWADRIQVGNVMTFRPAQRFDFVRTNLEYVPANRQPELISHVLADYLNPRGRLIIGTVNERADTGGSEPTLAHQLRAWSYHPRGVSERPHYHDPRLVYRVLWLDA